MLSLRSAMLLSVVWSTCGASVHWTQLATSGDPPSGGDRHTMTVLADGTIVMFGESADVRGEFYYRNAEDDMYTLAVSGNTTTWTQMSSSGDTPGGRLGHTMTVLADGTTVMFGGVDYSFKNDIHTLTVSGTTAYWTQLSSSGDIPGERYGHTMTVLTDDTVVLFGGRGVKERTDGRTSYGSMNDIYTLTVLGTTATWVELSSSGDTPSARSGHTMTVLADGVTVIFGGWSGGPLNDIYKLSVLGSAAIWTQLSSSGKTPSARDLHTITLLDDGTAVMFGGVGESDVSTDDIYTLTVSGTTATWTELLTFGDIPGPRCGHTMTVLADGTCVLFGGWDDYAAVKNDIYDFTLSGTTATPTPTSLPTPSPSPLPTQSPTSLPTRSPTSLPTRSPTSLPTRSPTPSPTSLPTPSPTSLPTRSPTSLSTRSPTSPNPLPTPTSLPTRSPTPLPTPCVNGALSSSYNAGGAFTCDVRQQLYGEDDCVTDEIARKCCHCGGGASITPSPTQSAPSTSSVEITLSMIATAEGKEQICEKTNLAMGGGTYQCFVDAVETAGVATSSVAFILSCPDRRLASNHIRRLNDEFKLVASAGFSDVAIANNFSESISESSSDIASKVEIQIAMTLGVNVTASIFYVELMANSTDSSASACHNLLAWTLTYLFVVSFFIVR